MNVKEQYVDITKFLGRMHEPQTKSGYTLYVRNNTNQNDDTDSGEDMQLYSKALQDPDYVKNMDTSYNSPKNIKRIHFELGGTHIYYHTSYYLKGQHCKAEDLHKQHILIDNSEKDLFDLLRSNINLNRKIMQGAISRNSNEKDIVKYVFDNANCSNNTLLKAATYKYVASNVEEIYFNWEVLLNRRVYEAFGFSSLDQVLNMYTPELMSGREQDGCRMPLALRQKLMQAFSNPEAAEKIKKLFIETNLGTSSSINKRFPRLRIVGILGCSVLNTHMDDKSLSSYERETSTWYDLRKEYLKKNCIPVTIIRFDGKLTEFNPGGAYKLDKEVSAKLSKQSDDLRALLVKEKYTSKETADEQVKSEVERKLIELSSQYDAETLGNLVRISIDSLTATEIKAMLADFTKENRSKYAKIIGIQI